MPSDDVSLTDLEVIQRFSLAVRGPVASRAEVVAALRSDLAWLTGEAARSAASPPAPAGRRPVPADRVPRRVPVRRPAPRGDA